MISCPGLDARRAFTARLSASRESSAGSPVMTLSSPVTVMLISSALACTRSAVSFSSASTETGACSMPSCESWVSFINC